MPVQLQEAEGGKIIEVQASGKLTREDYAAFVPEVERLIRDQGKVRILFDMRDFHGWEAGALWEDVKFDLKHFHHVERLALVGETRWQKGMSQFCRPFTTAKVRYFERGREQEARAWLRESETPEA